MQELSVFPLTVSDTRIHTIAAALDALPRVQINQVSWSAYPYRPQAAFSLAYGQEALYIKFYVEEAFVRAAHGRINSAVYEDSCVEFFISFDEGATYYNIEANCIGTLLVGYGSNRTDRVLLPAERIAAIARVAEITQSGGDNIHWTLTLAIPTGLFMHHRISALSDRHCRANFYKCGDGLPQPHFIAWSAIDAPEPDFHQPRFFGTLHFKA